MAVSTPDLLGIFASSYNGLVADAVSALKAGNLTFGEILSLGGSVTDKVAAFSKLSVHQKKYLVLDVLLKALDRLKDDKNSVFSSSQISDAHSVVKNSVPGMFDTLQDPGKDCQKKSKCSCSFLRCGSCGTCVRSVKTPVSLPVVLKGKKKSVLTPVCELSEVSEVPVDLQKTKCCNSGSKSVVTKTEANHPNMVTE